MHHYNIQNELLDSIEGQNDDSYLSIPEHDLPIYEDQTATVYVSFPIFQVHKIKSTLFALIQMYHVPASETVVLGPYYF